MDTERQELVNSLPVSGEIAYGDLELALQSQGKRALLRNFHDMRRNGEISARLEKQEDGTLKMFVKRP